jgi:hypothetical protein
MRGGGNSIAAVVAVYEECFYSFTSLARGLPMLSLLVVLGKVIEWLIIFHVRWRDLHSVSMENLPNFTELLTNDVTLFAYQ